MRYPLGTMINIPYGTKVRVEYQADLSFDGEIVGKASTQLEQSHIIRCTDETIPNDYYPYNTAVAPLGCIEVLE